MTDRLARQFAFLAEADRLKSVHRPVGLPVAPRRENAAEHSWHVALWALVLGGDLGGRQGRPRGARAGATLDRAIALIVLHEVPQVGPGDASSDDGPDPFARLPPDQAAAFRALQAEFAAGETTAARLARTADIAQPIFEELARDDLDQTDRDVLREALSTGRGAALASEAPALHARATALLERRPPPRDEALDRRLRFLAEADLLKCILRGTTLNDGSRRENSAEHSWHVMLHALTLAEHAAEPPAIARVLRMLLLHDIVEIDAGDVPIHAAADPALQAAKEELAADRLFGLLPAPDTRAARALWDEFEAAVTPDAIFARSIDRVQPVIANLESGGGSWRDYSVTREALEARVGVKVRRGAPALWDHLTPRLDGWFAAGRGPDAPAASPHSSDSP